MPAAPKELLKGQATSFRYCLRHKPELQEECWSSGGALGIKGWQMCEGYSLEGLKAAASDQE